MEEVLKLLIIGAGIGVVLLGVKFFSKKSETESEDQTIQEPIQQSVSQEAQEAIVDTAMNNTKDIQDDQKKIVAAITAAIKYHREG